MSKIIKTSNAPEPIGPYNQAVLAGETLYVSGQIAINPDFNELIVEDIKEETHQVMRNIGAILKEAKMSFSNVVKSSIFVSDMENFAVVNEIYGEYFSAHFPARETVEVSRLPKDVNVEISCIAVK